MEQNRRPRIVKRVPFYKRIAHAPEDYLMKVGNDIRALDWDMLQEGFSWPLALGLNLLLASVKMGYWLDDPLANVPTILKNDRAYYSKSMRPAFATLLASLQYLLVAISLLNAFWLFQSKKNYKMLERDVEEKPSASHVKMVEVQQDGGHWSLRFPGKLFWYSPAQVLILAGMNGENFHIFFPLSLAVGLQVHYLVSVYQSYVKDKQILYAEVQHEYNTKFVNPRIFVRKYDKQVSTETDTSDLSHHGYVKDNTGLRRRSDSSGSGAGSSQFVFDRKPRHFKHLSVPASKFSPTSSTSNSGFQFRAPSASQSSSSAMSDDEGEDEEEGDEREEYKEVDDDEEDQMDEDVSDTESGSEEDATDPDVDYDEDGEEPRVPHPTNSLRFDS
ncbi:hypothetical protein EDD11_008203 [Mortierella claussenii]|nr:hypothetical protein EDD11_008203 [Mortierella claussenii]